MPLTLGTNIASLRSQRRLNETQQKLGSVFERLSSGLRINRASDDSAGLAVASSLNTKHRVYSQGLRNINDGISALNITDAALDQLSSLTIRISELAEQAASGSLSNEQRESIDTEAQSLSDEFLRIAQSTEFNGIGLLDGTLDQLQLQAGYGDVGSIASILGGALADGTFSLSETYNGGTTTTDSLGYGDFNGDGNIDFISGGNLGEATVYLGDGNGDFTEHQTLTIGSSTITDIKVEDLNNDGVLDFTATNSSGKNVYIYHNDGSGSFTQEQRLTTGFDTSVSNVELNDFNGDGSLDIAVVGRYGTFGGVEIYLNQGNGEFETTTNYTFSSAKYNIIGDIEIGDFNGDNQNDILLVGQDPPLTIVGVHQILYSNGDGTFTEGTQNVGGNALYQTEIADLNGDGLLDYVATETGGNIRLFFNQGNNTFSEQTISPTSGSLSLGLSLGDITGDGNLDIVIGNNNDDITVFEGDGLGEFTESFQYTADGNINEIELADVNNDGVLDILTGVDNANRNATILLGNSTSGVNPLLDFDLTTQSGALQALSPLEHKLEQLTEQRGVIGAFQSRLESATRTLTATKDNYIAAESRIRDADIAKDTSEMIRLQILNNSSVAVLSQANLQPEITLQLLGV